ncbi:MAG: hypothetical protein IPO82_08035 [Betaproteobacteria bacterium]|nr:hypothetical protein [Betaproteobacteria bacterium]
MKRKTLGIAVAVAVGMLGTSAFAMTPMGNVSNKGSLLIYPRIDVEDGNDTLITLTNDSTGAVRLKCYYASSDDLGISYSGSASSAKSKKHFLDFTIDLTHNQPIAFWAKSGWAVMPSGKLPLQVAPPFGIFPDGQKRTAGELKCWAVTNDGSTELHYNHLFGTASIMNFGFNQASEYTAVAFQALGPSTLTGTALGSPGELNLDQVEYDGGPNILLGNFQPVGYDGARSRVTLASLNQDLRQDYTPTITKLTWTFWNQDEMARTGTHWCANSWFESWLPYFQASYASLGTAAAYFRIETTADKSVCGPSAVTSSYVGNIEQWNFGMYRATNLTGRGQAKGVIKYDVSPPDSYKK